MKLVIYQFLDHVVTDAANPADPEWVALDAIVKSWLYDLISLELRTAVSSPVASAHAIWVAIETLFRNNGLTRAMVLSDEFRNTKQLENPLSIYIEPSTNSRLSPTNSAISGTRSKLMPSSFSLFVAFMNTTKPLASSSTMRPPRSPSPPRWTSESSEMVNLEGG
jgi:hypothetical protein